MKSSSPSKPTFTPGCSSEKIRLPPVAASQTSRVMVCVLPNGRCVKINSKRISREVGGGVAVVAAVACAASAVCAETPCGAMSSTAKKKYVSSLRISSLQFIKLAEPGRYCMTYWTLTNTSWPPETPRLQRVAP